MNTPPPIDYRRSFRIGSREVGEGSPVYFIADIAANHDGDLERAKDLIRLAAEAGADAAKFQHFAASTIISDFEFASMRAGLGHQATWKKSVYQVYEEASLNLEWTRELKAACEACGIEFMTSPYAFDLVDAVDAFLHAYKIGSGDITWTAMLEYIAGRRKPVFLATGASTMDEVAQAVEAIARIHPEVCVMQCNTNYTGSIENFDHLHLRVLASYREMFPGAVLGLSDHTPGHAAVLGAVALGAKAVEKHFTDDNAREGPDHRFSMTPRDWREMVERTRELERALGAGIKRVEPNERQTVVIQRRSLCAARALEPGHTLREQDLVALRPCPADAFTPAQAAQLVGRVVAQPVRAGEALRQRHLR